ncbi:MAG: HD domain-containing protein [Anaerolineae bacterium]|nr:HD domain-containing protein [Anaerolineae bacterium]
MNREEVLYLAPYLISLILSFGIFLYAWRHRHVRGAKIYAIYLAGQTASILGFIFELISPNLEIKILWDKFQWFAGTFIGIVSFLIFSIQFSEHKLRHPRIFRGFWLAFPLIFTGLLLTDNIHHLIYPNPHLSTDFPFPELQYDFTAIVYVYSIVYIYGATLYGLVILIRRALQPHNLYRRQFLIVAAGVFFPVAFTIFALMNIRIAPQRDATPFSFAIGNLIVAIGLFRYRLFDIVPIARERVLENMADQVIVLDAQDRIIDINQAALGILGKKSSEVIGKSNSIIFSQWADLVQRFRGINDIRTEVKAIVREQPVYYELKISPIYNQGKQLVGRVVVAHDITKRKTLEDGYRQLSEELEQRVRERTEELAEAYDTTLEGWARALELRDKATEGHSRRVTESTLVVARAMNFDEDELIHVRRGAILHDIGKMGIPDEILRKPGPLTDSERQIVIHHPQVAYDLLVRIPHLKKALEIPYAHHEKWDGTGYPRGLKGEEIPLSARIFAVVDVWDALSFDRPYREAWPKEKVFQYLSNESGKYFDPKVVTIFLHLLEQGKI